MPTMPCLPFCTGFLDFIPLKHSKYLCPFYCVNDTFSLKEFCNHVWYYSSSRLSLSDQTHELTNIHFSIQSNLPKPPSDGSCFVLSFPQIPFSSASPYICYTCSKLVICEHLDYSLSIANFLHGKILLYKMQEQQLIQTLLPAIRHPY